MNASSRGKRKKRGTRDAEPRRSRTLLPAMMAAGGAFGLAPGISPAVELGELQLESALGQPLRASIAYALNPNEQLYDFCIFLKPGFTTDGIPYISRANVSIANGRIVLTGSMVIREPMLTMQLSVNCPYTAHLTRNYMVMLEPAAPDDARSRVVESQESTPAATRIVTTTVVTPIDDVRPAPAETPIAESGSVPDEAPVAESKPAPVVPADHTPVDTAPIQQGSRYLTQVGDTLSEIVSRIEDRPVGLWEGVDAVFAANAQAFDNNDKNLLRAGSWLEIPDLSAFDPAAATAPMASVDEGELLGDTAYTEEFDEAGYAGAIEDTGILEDADDEARSGYIAEDDADAGPALYEAPGTEESPTVEEPVGEPGDAMPAGEIVGETPADVVDSDAAEIDDEMQPGDVKFGDDTSFISPVDTSPEEVFAEEPVETIPETPITTESRPAPVVASSPSGKATSARSDLWSWLFWIVGGALVVVPALIVFGRRLRKRVAAAPTAQQSEAPAEERAEPEMPEQTSVVSDVDFQFDDDTISSQAINLDADLEAGTGLQDTSDMDVAQDFGFSATGELEEGDVDMELPEAAAREPEQATTEIIPPHLEGEPSIVDSEILPEERVDDSQYDLSMIVDATKEPLGVEDVTSKDLNAVLIGDEQQDAAADQTLTREVDIRMLEQDYQEEYTQTQALNEEIAQAAMELAETMAKVDESGDAAASDAGVTAELAPNVEAGNDDIGDLEETGINQELTIDEELTSEMPTAEMPASGTEPTNEMPQPGTEPTNEMRKPGTDPTVEMEVESGRVGGKKGGSQ